MAGGMTASRRQSSARRRGRARRPDTESARGDSSLLAGARLEQGRSRRILAAAALIVLATATVYLNSFQGVFLLDDNGHIVHNPRIRQLAPAAWLASRRPLVELSFALNYHFGKLDPWGYHLFNLVVHLLAGLTLFGIVRRTLLLDRFKTACGPGAEAWALAVALIWVVHPLQTQSVTYLVQRGESMAGLFYLLTLYCAIRGMTAIRPRTWYAAAIVSCALGMTCKAVVVTAPVLVLLYDFVCLGPSLRAVLRRRWGLYAGLAATGCILPALGLGGIFKTTAAGQATVGFAYHGITPSRYLLTQPGVLLHYLRLCVWPAGQCLDYGWPPAQGLRDAALPGGLVLAMLGATVWSLRRRSWVGLAGAWFFGILAPTSSFIPIKDLAFEHRMYLPLAAIVVLGVFGGRHLSHGLQHASPVSRRNKPRPSRPLGGGVAVGLIVLVLGAATIRRNFVYHSELAMWRDVRDHAPHNPRAHFGYARALDRLGRSDEALEAYQTTIRISPDYAKAHLNLGDLYVRMNKTAAAVDAFRAALKAQPNWAEAHTRLGLALAMRGASAEAIDAFRTAIRIDPDSAAAHYYLAFALEQAGRNDEAARAYETVLRLDPRHPDAGRRLADLNRRAPANNQP